MPEITVHHAFVEGIVAGGNRGMGGEQAAGAHKFHSLAVIHLLVVHVFAKAFQAYEGSMPLV